MKHHYTRYIPYTTVHDIQDITEIFADRRDYKVVFWNFTDHKYEHLNFRDLDEDPPFIYRLRFSTGPTSVGLNTVGEWADFIKKFKSPMEINYAWIWVINSTNGQQMKISFTGSSDVDKTVHYNIDYADENYHFWKRTLFWKWFNFKYIITHPSYIFDKIKKLFK